MQQPSRDKNFFYVCEMTVSAATLDGTDALKLLAELKTCCVSYLVLLILAYWRVADPCDRGLGSQQVNCAVK